ncbi:MAG TPA: hypothetical protein PKC58_17610 [Ignavibacteria bacterium]|nr:hypothetical protein [Ignavibacteria bacterium]
MIYKYSISISGDDFYPQNVLEKIQGNFVVNNYFKPTDKKPINISEEYGYGSMSFLHPNKSSTENEIIEYEMGFIEFIEKNFSFFTENGANEFEIFIEIYFDGGQCNFEIFSKDLLKKLGSFGVSLPISIYVLKNEEIQKWEDEIKIVWESR